MTHTTSVPIEPEIPNVRISPLELLLIAIVVLTGCFWGAQFVPETKYWDDLLYIHTAWTMEALPTILNRYATIYLLSIFNIIAGGDPLLGARYFGAFTSSAVVALVYLNARLLAKTQPILVGLLAAAFILTYDAFIDDFGLVLADYTATVMILLGILVFILHRRIKRQGTLLLILFGLMIFLAIKSKETGFLLCLLIPGFFTESDDRFTPKEVLLKLSLIAAGCLIGLIIFLILNGVFLGNVFFGMYSSDIQELLRFNGSIGFNQQDIKDNFLYYIASNSTFLLSLIWIFKSDERLSREQKWLWISTLSMIPFLSLTVANGGWGIVPRYLTPGVAILSILAAQIIQLEIPSNHQRKNGVVPAIIMGSLLVSAVFTLVSFHLFARPREWGFYYFAVGVLAPAVLCFLLFFLFFDKVKSPFRLSITVICIGILTLPAATYNVSTLVSDHTQLPSRFTPFIVFNDSVDCSTESVLISGKIHQEHGTLGRNAASSRWMFNLFFRCHMARQQFAYSTSNEELSKKLLGQNFQYVFLEASDYEYLVNHETPGQKILQRYSVEMSEGSEYYLFTLNSD